MDKKKITAKRVWLVALSGMFLLAVLSASLDPNPAGAVDLDRDVKLTYEPGEESIHGLFVLQDSSLAYRAKGQGAWSSLPHEVLNAKAWKEEIASFGVLERRKIKVKVMAAIPPVEAERLSGAVLEFRFRAKGKCPRLILGSDDTYDEHGFSVRGTTTVTARLAAGHADYPPASVTRTITALGVISTLTTIFLGLFLVIRWFVRRRKKMAGGGRGLASAVARGVATGVASAALKDALE